MTLRVLVVDNHPLYRNGLVTALGAMPDVQVVEDVGDGEAAVRAAADLQPDVVVMDLHMPGLNGIDATRRITGERPGTAVLVLTMLEGDDSVFAAMRADARGYLLVVFSAGIAERVLAFFAAAPAGPALIPFPELTDREGEVLDLVARGLTNAEIARRLVLSAKTVHNHVSNVFAKLRVAGRAEAVARARDAALGA